MSSSFRVRPWLNYFQTIGTELEDGEENQKTQQNTISTEALCPTLIKVLRQKENQNKHT